MQRQVITILTPHTSPKHTQLDSDILVACACRENTKGMLAAVSPAAMSLSGVGSRAVGSSEVVSLAVGSPGLALAGLRLEVLSWRKEELGGKRAIASIFSRDSLGVCLAALGGGFTAHKCTGT